MVTSIEALGGLPKITVCDNLKSGVLKTGQDPILNPAYKDMADRYGTVILPARPRRPKDKPKVGAAATPADESEGRRGVPAGSAFSREDILRRVALQRQVGVHPLEPAQLTLDVLLVAQLRNLHADVLVLPDVVRRLADAVLAARLDNLRAGLDLLEDPDDLFLAELRLLHAELLRWGNSTSDWLESTRTLHTVL